METGPKKILIIEDDQFIRELYERQLKKAGYEVVSTFSGKTGVELLDKETFDLLMLDLNIPDFSGFQILEHIKKTNPKRNFNVLILSNVAADEMINKAMSLGAQAFIVKSTYTPEQVVDEVNSLLA